MKPLIVFYSKTGNTDLVSHRMAAVLGADIIPAERIKESDLKGRKLVGLGSGIYGMRHHKSLFKAAELIPKNCKVFIFSTSGVKIKFLIKFAHSFLRKKLASRGIKITREWNCPGHDRFVLLEWLGINLGRPDDEDLRKAERFVKSL